MKELNIKELPTFPQAHPTGEIGVRYEEGRWERNGQQIMCPLSRLILTQQPNTKHWIQAAALVTGWTPHRCFAFKCAMGSLTVVLLGKEVKKGKDDAALYGLLHKLSRKSHRERQSD